MDECLLGGEAHNSSNSVFPLEYSQPRPIPSFTAATTALANAQELILETDSANEIADVLQQFDPTVAARLLRNATEVRPRQCRLFLTAAKFLNLESHLLPVLRAIPLFQGYMLGLWTKNEVLATIPDDVQLLSFQEKWRRQRIRMFFDESVPGDRETDFATPLELAIQHDDIDAIKALSTNPDFDWDQKVTPALYETLFIGISGGIRVPMLCYAAICHSQQCFRYLLLNGSRADSTAVDSGGRNLALDVMSLAAGCGNVEFITMLDSDYYSGALVTAARMQQNDLLAYLLDECNVDVVMEIDGKCALIAAAEGNNVTGIGLLLDHGAQLQHAFVTGATALHFAAINGSVEAARALIEKGLFVGVHDKKGENALHYCAEKEQPEVAEFLIEQGIDPNSENCDQWRPLQCCAGPNSVKVAQLLLKSGADIEAADKEGITALMMACFHGSIGMATLLVENGATINRKDFNRRSAINYAELGHHGNILSVLTAHDK